MTRPPPPPRQQSVQARAPAASKRIRAIVLYRTNQARQRAFQRHLQSRVPKGCRRQSHQAERLRPTLIATVSMRQCPCTAEPAQFVSPSANCFLRALPSPDNRPPPRAPSRSPAPPPIPPRACQQVLSCPRPLSLQFRPAPGPLGIILMGVTVTKSATASHTRRLPP